MEQKVAMREKLARLRESLAEKKRLAVAFSGGVDSVFLLKVAHEVLGDEVVAITAKVRAFPQREREEAEAFCRKEKIRHIVLEIDELAIEGFAANPVNRCYLCKKALLRKICAEADAQGITTVAEGSNLDDVGDYRPGLLAVAELGVWSPLREAGMDKRTVRALARELKIAAWNKPSFACLATRFVYGEQITAEKLALLDAAEQFLLDEGFTQVRVRIHGQEENAVLARIEIEKEELPRMLAEGRYERVHQRLRELGFAYVTLDLGGYRTGSMNINTFLCT